MIKAAVIGLGWWGRLITTTLKDSDKIEVVCIAARTPSKHQDFADETGITCLLYTSPSPRDQRGSRMPSSA